ncbi:PepSY domain-containing protein [Candidatus Woesearchaeota archaeon]|nr:PepSY domain-containing protein [Candidatus Woesearchaeota archaeon]
MTKFTSVTMKIFTALFIIALLQLSLVSAGYLQFSMATKPVEKEPEPVRTEPVTKEEAAEIALAHYGAKHDGKGEVIGVWHELANQKRYAHHAWKVAIKGENWVTHHVFVDMKTGKVLQIYFPKTHFGASFGVSVS